jgi:hypothetical protein
MSAEINAIPTTIQAPTRATNSPGLSLVAFLCAAFWSRLVGFAAGIPDGLPRKDRRARDKLYVRGLLTDGGASELLADSSGNEPGEGLRYGYVACQRLR